MAEFKGTKGEWELLDDWSKGIDNHTIIVYSNYSEKSICEIELINSESNANAKIIAAAPELLEALEEIIEMNRQTALDQYGDAEKAESWSCVTIARKAIKKATE